VNVWNLLEWAAERHGDREAVAVPGGGRTWAEVERRCRALAAGFADLGVAPGDVVALREDNTEAFLLATYATAALGATLQPLHARLAAPEVASALGASGARVLLAAPRHAPSLAGALAGVRSVVWLPPDPVPETAPEFAGVESLPLDALLEADGGALRPELARESGAAQLYTTSGTTGAAKGVPLTHRNVCAHARNAIAELELTEGDTWGHVAPMYHLADAWATLAVTAIGGRHAFLPRFDAAAALELVAEARITVTNLVPIMLERMLDEQARVPRDVSSLRLLLTGGAPVAPGAVARVRSELGCAYAQTYGLTETSPYLTISLLPAELEGADEAEQLAWLARTGRPFRGVEVQVVDDAGRPVATDDRTVGEVRARGETVFGGYRDAPEETARAVRDGWFHTGDLATVNEGGSLNIVDRGKDVVLTGAENVYSIEVEHALASHPDVAEVAVFGVPDEEWGEAVTAAVVLREGAVPHPEGLRAHCRERLAGFKVPRGVRFVEELPRTSSGKVAKARLREGS
jgi:acyl-CoA synthetase (AMP-forming)/AMP-acid ligase II